MLEQEADPRKVDNRKTITSKQTREEVRTQDLPLTVLIAKRHYQNQEDIIFFIREMK